MSSVETETLVTMIISAQSHHTVGNCQLKRNPKDITQSMQNSSITSIAIGLQFIVYNMQSIKIVGKPGKMLFDNKGEKIV